MADRKIELDADVYAHLHALAERIYAERGHGHTTVQPTMLLHEAWMKMSGSEGGYASRRHFVAVAARAMRQVLIDRGRANDSQKRGGAEQRQVTLTGLADDPVTGLDLLDLDRALTELEEVDPRGAEIAVLRTFGGMTMPEIAETLDLSERTVQRDWRVARAFLVSRMES